MAKNVIDLKKSLILLLEKVRGNMTAVVIMFPEEEIEKRLLPCVNDIQEMMQELLKQ